MKWKKCTQLKWKNYEQVPKRIKNGNYTGDHLHSALCRRCGDSYPTIDHGSSGLCPECAKLGNMLKNRKEVNNMSEGELNELKAICKHWECDDCGKIFLYVDIKWSDDATMILVCPRCGSEEINQKQPLSDTIFGLEEEIDTIKEQGLL